MGILEEPFNLFVYLSESIGLNLAIPLFFITPAILFIAKPSSSLRLKVITTIVAIICAYILLNLAIYTGQFMRWHEHQACQERFTNSATEHQNECDKIRVGNGIALYFYPLIGWLPGGAYIGVWELIWRRKYRQKLREHGKPKFFWVSSIPIWLLYVCLAWPVISITSGLIAQVIYYW